MNIGIDFDDTLITCSSDCVWKFKRGSVETLIKLRDKGYTFYIITARPDTEFNRKRLKIVTDSLLDKGVSIVKYVFTDYQNKGVFARELGCSYMIDDCAEYLSDCVENGITPIHLLRSKKHESRDGYTVVYSWEDIYDILP